MKAGKTLVAAALLLTLLAAPSSSFADKKKKSSDATGGPRRRPSRKSTYSKLVWPGPPNIPRVRYINYMAGQKFDTTPADQQPKVKQTWMDRLAGTQPEKDKKLKQMPFQLLGPYGMASDSKGNLFVADQRVGAIFIFNTETRDASLIRNKFEATLELPNGVAIDDDDRIFISRRQTAPRSDPERQARSGGPDQGRSGRSGRTGHRYREPPALRRRHATRPGGGLRRRYA